MTVFFSTTPNPSSQEEGTTSPVAPNEETTKKTLIELGECGY